MITRKLTRKEVKRFRDHVRSVMAGTLPAQRQIRLGDAIVAPDIEAAVYVNTKLKSNAAKISALLAKQSEELNATLARLEKVEQL